MEIKLIGQRLADIRQRKTHAMYMYIMQISYPCIVFLFHSQHIHKIRNNIRKHSQAFLLLFLVGNKSNFIALIMFNNKYCQLHPELYTFCFQLSSCWRGSAVKARKPKNISYTLHLNCPLEISS